MEDSCNIYRIENLAKEPSLKNPHPAGIYLLKITNKNTRTRCEICSKLTIKTPERRHEHVIVGWALANFSKNIQDTQVLEAGLHDFHKMTATVLEMFYVKQKLNTVLYRSYKKIDNGNFMRQLHTELMNFDINNIEFKAFHSIFLSVSTRHAFFKQKHFRRIMQLLSIKSYDKLS